MTQGAFITVEGAEGVGKTTGLAAVESHLAALGRAALLTREPGGTELGERVRDWVLNGDHGPLTAEVESLLMFAARAHHLERVIRPALARGTWVVCDRFTDATHAYQGGGRGAKPALLDCLTREVHGGLMPDLTLLLDAPIEVGMERIRAREHDHFEREQRDFFERVRQTYLEIAAADPQRVKIVDASGPLDEVRTQLIAYVDDFNQRFASDRP